MKISDELREWADVHCGEECEEYLGLLADRIDAEHQKAIRELNNLADASVLLPVDADGVPIHIGDVMDKGRVTCIRDCGKGWEVILDSLYTFDTPILHHRAPTVEDVLREMLEQAVGYSDAHTTVALNAIAEYSAKLRLAGEDE